MKALLVTLLATLTLVVTAQDIVLPPDYIKSIQLTGTETNPYVPVISKDGSITLSFDDLEGDEKNYYYMVEHCDRDWNTSDLLPTEYVSGYEKEKIYNYNNSFNTLQYYTNYQVTLPNKNTRFLISGNYRLSILDIDDNVVFTRYFIIYEPLTTVGVSVHRTRDMMYIDTQQTVKFVINYPGVKITSPQEEIFPVIYQNFDFSTKVEGLKPQFMRPDQLIYKYDEQTSFWGGNEFLNFDTKELLMTNNTVARVVSGEDLYRSLLYVDEPRESQPYTYYPDVNGAFVVRNIKADDSNTEADYTWVHFSLKTSEIIGETVYVYGAFNNYQLTDENQMTYNSDMQTYEADILLKQGFYNYTYVSLGNDDVIDAQAINGSYDATENDYQVLVYYAKFGSNYDRVIGYGVGSSRNLSQ